MYEKSTTISKSYLKSVYDNNKSLILLCGNNSVDQIENSATYLWFGTDDPPVYLYSKAWFIPRTSTEGTGDTLQSIINYMDSQGIDNATFKVVNSSKNVITADGTGAKFSVGSVNFNDWGRPPV
ncbi:MAG: hypothetical protein V2A61_00740 [Calditrichota bacterium]